MTTRHNTADFSSAALQSPKGPIGQKGPWQLSDGSVVFFAYSTSTGTITAYKSNPAVGINTAGSWTAQSSTWTIPSWTSGNNLGDINAGNAGGFGGFQVGDTIHIAVINPATNTLYYQTYNASTNVWGTATSVSTATKGTSWGGCGIVVRSGGDVVIGYNNIVTISKTNYDRPVYARRVSGTWTADVAIITDTTTAGGFPLRSVTLGASDRVHFTWHQGVSGGPYTWWHRSLDSTQALDTAQQFLSTTTITSYGIYGQSDFSVNTSGTTNIHVPIEYFNSGSGQWVVGIAYFASQANPTSATVMQYGFQDSNMVGVTVSRASWDPQPRRERWMGVYTASSPSPPIAYYYFYIEASGTTGNPNFVNDFNPDNETPEFIANSTSNMYTGVRAIQDPTDGSVWVVGINQYSYAAITAFQDYAGPGVPTNVKITRAGCNGVELSWANGGSATSYHVYQNGTQIGTTTNTYWTDTTLDPGTAYSYTVRGVANAFESADSAAVTGTTQAFQTPADLIGVGMWTSAFSCVPTVADGANFDGLNINEQMPEAEDLAYYGSSPQGLNGSAGAGTITFRKSGINTAPAVEVAGTGFNNQLFGGASGDSSKAAYLFVVTQPSNVSAAKQAITIGQAWSTTSANFFAYLDTNNHFWAAVNDNAAPVDSGVTAVNGTPTLLTMYSDGTTSSFFTVEKKGGTATKVNASGAGSTFSASGNYFGQDQWNNQWYYGGRFSEVLILEGPLSTATLADVQAYFRNIYLATTPPTHIYASDSGAVTESGSTSVIPQISASDSGIATDAGTVYAPTTITLFSSPTAAAELSGIGGTFSTTAPGTTATTQALAKVTGWGEILAKGNASAWPGLASQGAVSGKGWWFDSTTLEGTVLQVPGSEASTLDWYTNAGSPVVTIVVRFFKWSAGGGFSLLGSINQTTNYTLPTATSTFGWLNQASFVLAGTAFATGEKLYMDLWANVTTGSGSNSATINYQPNSSQLTVAYMVPYTLNITNLEQGVASESTSIAVIPTKTASDAGSATDSGVSYSVSKMPPDAVLATTNIAATLASVTDDPDAPDGTFDSATIITNADDMRTSFGTPTGALKTGGPYQEFRIYLRPSGG